MSDPNRPLSEVPALLEERHRYEAWLAALDARRESTPEHVFQRVQADYRSRLDRVDERLAAYRQTIQDERASLESRLSLLKAEEQLRRDEHAELELRSHVGELIGNEAESAFSAVDEVITQLVSEKDELLRQIGELDTLLQVRPRATPEPAPAVAAPKQPEASRAAEPREPRKPRESRETKVAPPPPSGGSFDELAFLSEVVGGKGQGPVSRASSAPAPAPAPAQAIAPAPAPAPKAQPWAQGHDQPQARPQAQAQPQPQSTRISQASTISRDESASESLLSGLSNGTLRPSNEPPFAANVSGNMPIVLKTSGSAEQAKTLKCGECSTMNYPTEWYCERCGAELAAL